jgi:hypothetical protein
MFKKKPGVIFGERGEKVNSKPLLPSSKFFQGQKRWRGLKETMKGCFPGRKDTDLPIRIGSSYLNGSKKDGLTRKTCTIQILSLILLKFN